MGWASGHGSLQPIYVACIMSGMTADKFVFKDSLADTCLNRQIPRNFPELSVGRAWT